MNFSVNTNSKGLTSKATYLEWTELRTTLGTLFSIAISSLSIINNVLSIIVLVKIIKESNQYITPRVYLYYLLFAITAINSILPNQLSDFLGMFRIKIFLLYIRVFL